MTSQKKATPTGEAEPETDMNSTDRRPTYRIVSRKPWARTVEIQRTTSYRYAQKMRVIAENLGYTVEVVHPTLHRSI